MDLLLRGFGSFSLLYFTSRVGNIKSLTFNKLKEKIIIPLHAKVQINLYFCMIRNKFGKFLS